MNPLHYPSLELCKKLTEIGFPKTFCWYTNARPCYDDEEDAMIVEKKPFIMGYDFIPTEYWAERYACPSVMEMLDVIPRVHPEDEWIYNFIQRCYQGQNVFQTWYVPNYHRADNICEFYWTLPDALAEMILWLVENKHLSFYK